MSAVMKMGFLSDGMSLKARDLTPAQQQHIINLAVLVEAHKISAQMALVHGYLDAHRTRSNMATDAAIRAFQFIQDAAHALNRSQRTSEAVPAFLNQTAEPYPHERAPVGARAIGGKVGQGASE